jgi:hypothetical protein
LASRRAPFRNLARLEEEVSARWGTTVETGRGKLLVRNSSLEHLGERVK